MPLPPKGIFPQGSKKDHNDSFANKGFIANICKYEQTGRKYKLI
jgi:hypothetical protein